MNLDRAEEFHGQSGAVVGCRHARGPGGTERVDARKHFECAADSGRAAAPCLVPLVDGLQLGTGATTGKRRIWW